MDAERAMLVVCLNQCRRLAAYRRSVYRVDAALAPAAFATTRTMWPDCLAAGYTTAAAKTSGERPGSAVSSAHERTCRIVCSGRLSPAATCAAYAAGPGAGAACRILTRRRGQRGQGLWVLRWRLQPAAWFGGCLTCGTSRRRRRWPPPRGNHTPCGRSTYGGTSLHLGSETVKFQRNVKARIKRCVDLICNPNQQLRSQYDGQKPNTTNTFVLSGSLPFLNAYCVYGLGGSRQRSP